MDGDFIEIPDPYIIIHIHIHSFIYIQMTYRGYLFFFFKVEHIIEVNFTSGFNANTLLVFIELCNEERQCRALPS